jgi:hypothetical protein
MYEFFQVESQDIAETPNIVKVGLGYGFRAISSIPIFSPGMLVGVFIGF